MLPSLRETGLITVILCHAPSHAFMHGMGFFTLPKVTEYVYFIMVVHDI